ncbi:MAG: beta-hydroxyacyl-ACP dehydratase [Planctomycetes bacterium]|nr:beta-hydroxyacyl-ACP dehydratase [Planctomycetota bacterium]
MAARDLILDFSEYDVNHIVAGLEEIRRYNLQRYEMEQLTAIIYEDPVRNICAGYKDLTDHEFWIRGHMPGMPLMPGVMMCEAAAQMCSYFAIKQDLLGSRYLGFGGLEDVRFRDPVLPGSRLVVVSQLLRVRRGAMIVCRFQCFVERSLVCEGVIKGVPLPNILPSGKPVRLAEQESD